MKSLYFKTLLKLAAILLLFGWLGSCTPTDRLGNELEKEPGKPGSEPETVSFTEYSLEETACSWINPALNEVIVINSNEDMEKYINCIEGSYPEIDFSKNTLLLASSSDKDVKNIDASFFKDAANNYTVKVTVSSGNAAETVNWNVAILTSKIPNDAIITLEKEENNEQCVVCKDAKVIKVLKDEPAYIRKECFEHLGKIDTFYIEHATYYPELCPALFPCNAIPEEYRIEDLSIKISGDVYNCFIWVCSEPNIKIAPFNTFKLKSIKPNKQ